MSVFFVTHQVFVLYFVKERVIDMIAISCLYFHMYLLIEIPIAVMGIRDFQPNHLYPAPSASGNIYYNYYMLFFNKMQ